MTLIGSEWGRHRRRGARKFCPPGLSGKRRFIHPVAVPGRLTASRFRVIADRRASRSRYRSARAEFTLPDTFASLTGLVNRRVTHKDIAERLGLDKSTVSLALRNNRGISAATRQRVQAMAEELGYRPDPALSTLARQRWAGHETGSGSALAYLIDSRTENASHLRRFLLTARQRAEQRGYVLHEFDLAAYPTMKTVGRILLNRGIRGLLLPEFPTTNGPGILDLPVSDFTVVGLGQGWLATPFHFVARDIFAGTRRIWGEVVKRGYQRIGGAILWHTPQAVDDAARYGASAAAQFERVPVRRRLPFLTTGHSDRDGFLAWMDRHRPDAVIGFMPWVYDWIIGSGRRVPQDVAFASLSVVRECEAHISGMVRQADIIGAAGVDALIAAMHEDEWGVPPLQHALLLEPLWNEGTTLPSMQASAAAAASKVAAS